MQFPTKQCSPPSSIFFLRRSKCSPSPFVVKLPSQTILRSKLTLVLTVLTRIQEVSGSNLCRDTDYPEVLRCIPSLPSRKCLKVGHEFPYTSSRIHHHPTSRRDRTGGCTAPWGAVGLHSGALQVGPQERVVRLFTIEVTLERTLWNWYHFIKPIHRIKNLLTVTKRNAIPVTGRGVP
jgi:hypothetical protein